LWRYADLAVPIRSDFLQPVSGLIPVGRQAVGKPNALTIESESECADNHLACECRGRFLYKLNKRGDQHRSVTFLADRATEGALVVKNGM
jgi:hypothetical protein